ncbi:uncharacterized protein LOC114912197 isoform X2 [Scleropages formosus]|uniref:uncharacterized protein LOC114912197 isoform X2 n=1 Tax=Scleropages formosus TaxID=113540 RepID=UPI0010FAAF64|nr:uncharacterized protein LOC114912197 isoform X2 [Scleropages formosus]
MRPPRTDTLLAIAVFLLLLRFRLTFAQQQCDLTALVGDEVTVPLGYSGATEDNRLIWKRGHLTIFDRVDKRVRRGKLGDVTSDGSLVLRRVTMDQSGLYSAQVIDRTGLMRHNRVQTLCVAETVYGLLGAEAELDPGANEKIKEIIWKKSNTKISEWKRDKVVYYGRCETGEQCDLNNSTGVLVMKGLKAEDEGRYLAEINGKTPLTGLDLIPLKPVSKPSVTTSCSWTQCILTCVGEETKHTKYSWKENNETVKEGNTLMVEKSGEQSKSYTCVFSNPKSEEHSDPLTEMDLFPDNKGYDMDQEPVLERHSSTMDGWTYEYFVAILVAAVAVTLLMMMLYYCRRFYFKHAESRDTIYKADEPPGSATVDSVPRDPNPQDQMRQGAADADGENLMTLV